MRQNRELSSSLSPTLKVWGSNSTLTKLLFCTDSHLKAGSDEFLASVICTKVIFLFSDILNSLRANDFYA